MQANADHDADEEQSHRAAAANWWYRWVSSVFWDAYLETCGNAPLLPADPQIRQALLEVYLIQKAVYELGYELNNRPEWLSIPVAGIVRMLAAEVPA